MGGTINFIRCSGITLTGCFAIALSGNNGSAQIIPDSTLGAERSVVTPNANVRALPAELIEGGALRGTNLFHSFQEFNVGNGQRVYFANPAGIDNILSRVTGNNLSKIFGTLGVDGGANLFLLNPNGIIFGPNARLDVAGSFVGSTANSLVFGNGLTFSAKNPEAPPLLKISLTQGLQYGTNQPSATITNVGHLAVGQDLTLAAGNLDLRGQLYAGGNLTLFAQDTVKVRDRITNPFIAAAGGQLLVQGNQNVDIFALNHPESGLFSGGDMVLRSTNTVGGDAHYTTRGSFRIEQLNGSLGNLFSPYDPIIRASGDVNFNTYTGTSLHILAGGSVNINSITITGADATGNTINPTSTPTLANVTLSDGTPLVINGTAQPTVDIRAGTTAFGTPGITGTNFTTLFPPRPNTTAPATGANITIGEIDINAPNGLVFLTNQYQPNTALSRDIQVTRIRTSDRDNNGSIIFSGNSGSIIIDSRGDIKIPNTGSFRTNSAMGNAGDMTFIAAGSFFMTGNTPSQLVASTFGQGNAGNINIFAGNAVSVTGDSIIVTNVESTAVGDGGNINIQAGSLSLTNGAQLQSSVVQGGRGNARNVNINVRDRITLAQTDYGGQPSLIDTGVDSEAVGNGGNINIQAGSISIDGTAAIQSIINGQGNAGNILVQVNDFVSLTNGGVISTQVTTGGEGNSGNIQISAPNAVNLSGFNPIYRLPSGLYANSEIGTSGQAGNITVNTGAFRVVDGALVDGSTANANEGGKIAIIANTFELTGGGTVQTASFGTGNAGDLSITATDSMSVNQSIISTGSTGAGNGGNLFVNTRQLNVTNGGEIQTISYGMGKAGDLSITATDSISVSGKGSITTSSLQGDSGNLSIFTGQLNVSGEETSLTTLSGTGNAGDLSITATDSINVSNQSTITTASTGAGDSGNLSINTRQLNVSDPESVVGTNSFGTGKAGNLAIAARDSMNVSDQGIVTTSSSQGNSGNLSISTGQLNVKNGQIDTLSYGTGNAGNLAIAAMDSVNVSTGGLVTTGTDKSSAGNGGNLSISTKRLDVNNGGLSTAALGQGNAGNLSVIATDSMNVVNQGYVTTSSTEGIAGNLDIETGKLSIRDNSFVFTSTVGSGDSGNLTVRKANAIEVLNGSSLSSATIGTGKGGDVRIETENLVVDGSKLSADTFSSGNGGNLTIETGNLSVRNGGEISTGVFTESSGQGGNLSVNASNSVELNGGSLVTATAGTGRAGDLTVNTRTFTAQGGGRVEAGTAGLNQGGTVTVNASESIELSGKSPSGITPTAISAFSRPPADVDSNLWTGNANSGGVTLNTKNLIIRDGAQVTTAVEGRSQTGNAGGVQVQADSLDLTDSGSITSRSEGRGRAGDISVNLKDNLRSSGGIISATSTQAGGGNVNINANDIRLRNSSLISSSVFDSTGGGGNININSKIFIALEDSDILANAFDGRGGDITIKSPAFLADLFSSGKAVAVGRNPGDFSPFRGNGRVDISAEATGSGTSGTVTLPTLDLTRGLTQLPSDLVDAERLIDRRCTPAGVAKRSSFTVTGRGGLPPSPNEPLRGEAVTADWISINSEGEKRDRSNSTANPTSATPQQLVEAQGWVIGANGQVILTAQAPTVTPQNPGLSVPPCQGSQTTTK